MSWSKRIRHPSKLVALGDEVDIELKDGQIKARINKIYAKKNKN